MSAQVVFVNRYFHPDESATSRMLSDLAFRLAGQGLPVTVVTSRQLYEDPNARLPARETQLELRREGACHAGPVGRRQRDAYRSRARAQRDIGNHHRHHQQGPRKTGRP